MAALPPNPFLPQTIRKYALAFGSGEPTAPVPGSSITQQAWDQINPQLQAAADMINRRSQLGSQAIAGLTQSYAQGMGQLSGQIPGFYNSEIDLARKEAGYGQQMLTQAGQTTGAGFDAALQQAGQQGPGDINLPQQGAGAGTAAYGTGIAELDALIANKAAAQTQAALEPGFAQGLGGYQQNLLSMQLARQLGDIQGQLAGQVPGIIDTLTQRDLAAKQRAEDLARSTAVDQRDYQEKVREFNAEQARLAAGDKASVAVAKAQAAAKAGDAAAKEAWNYADRMTKASDDLYLPKQLPNGQWKVVNMGPKTGKAPKQPTNTGPYYKDPNTGKWDLKPGYHTDPVTNKPVKDLPPPKPKAPGVPHTVKRNGVTYQWDPGTKTWKERTDLPTETETAKAATATKPPTQNQIQTLVTKWHQGTISRTETVNAKGETSTSTTLSQNPITYQQAYRKLRGMKLSDADAHKYLDPVYKRGEAGRPWLNANARQTLSKAGLQPAVRYTGNPNKGATARKAIPYLTKPQVTALKAAGQLPPGAWATGPSGAEVYIVQAGY